MVKPGWLLAACLYAASAHGADELYLEVTVNAQPSGKIMRFTQGARGLRTSVENLRELGLPAQGAPADEVDLAALQGLEAVYDAAAQSVALRLPDALRQPLALEMGAGTALVDGEVSTGLLLNYDVLAQAGADRSAQFNGELRYFDARGLFSTNGGFLAGAGAQRWLRYDSYWSSYDPATLRTVQAGDLVSSSLMWNRSMRMGGIQLRKRFDLRPDLVTYPVASLQGSAAVPSALELYVNGIRQYAGDVPAGPYVLNRVSGISGAGNATLVTRDAQGRAATLQFPLYVDTRMLARGISEYSVEAGVLRRAYGLRAFDYGRAAASASGRVGVSDRITLEGHAELAQGLAHGGAGVLFGLGQAGVLNGNLAANNGAGMQYGAGYQYISPGFGLDAQLTRANGRVRDLAALEGSAPARASSRLSLTKALGQQQSISIAHAGFRHDGEPAARVASLAYSRTLGRRAFFNAALFRNTGERADRGAFASLTLALGQMSASLNAGRQGGLANHGVALSAPAPYDGGLGWSMQAGTQGQQRYGQVQGQYLGRLGQLTATVARYGEQTRVAAEASGSVVMIGGALAAARQVGSGFAMVSTGLPGIPVVHENRTVGVTDARGYLLVPNLRPFGANRLAIDGSLLPADARIASSERTVAPRHLAGVVVRFPVERYRAATVLLQDDAGAALPPGLPVRHAGGDTVTGYNGMVFIDGLAADNRLEVGEGAERCVVRFAWDEQTEASLQVIGPLRCERAGTP